MLQYARPFSLVCIAVFFIVIGSTDAVNEHFAFIALLPPALLQGLYHVLAMRANSVQRDGLLDFQNLGMGNATDAQSMGRGYIQLFACLFILVGLFGIVVESFRLAFCVSGGMFIYAANYHFHHQQ